MHFPLSPEGHENIVCHAEGIFRELRPHGRPQFFRLSGANHAKVSAPLLLRAINAEWRAAPEVAHHSDLTARGNSAESPFHPRDHLLGVIHGHGRPKSQRGDSLRHENIAAPEVLGPGLGVVVILLTVDFKPQLSVHHAIKMPYLLDMVLNLDDVAGREQPIARARFRDGHRLGIDQGNEFANAPVLAFAELPLQRIDGAFLLDHRRFKNAQDLHIAAAVRAMAQHVPEREPSCKPVGNAPRHRPAVRRAHVRNRGLVEHPQSHVLRLAKAARHRLVPGQVAGPWIGAGHGVDARGNALDGALGKGLADVPVGESPVQQFLAPDGRAQLDNEGLDGRLLWADACVHGTSVSRKNWRRQPRRRPGGQGQSQGMLWRTKSDFAAAHR
jgi:hypothetical protein